MRYLALVLLLACSSGSPIEPNPPSGNPPPGEPPPPPPPPPPPEPPPPTPGLTASLAILSGASQQAEVANELPQSVVVQAKDAQDVPVPGQIINWVIVSGGGSVFAGTALTNDLGEARERWTLGTTAGEQALEARAVDPATGDPIVFTRITATADPGPSQTLTLSQSSLRMKVGASVDLAPLVESVKDQYGNERTSRSLAVTAPAFAVVGTVLTADGEAQGAAHLSDGSATASLSVTALRDLADLTGGRGHYKCVKDVVTYEVNFTVDSVAQERFWVSQTTFVTGQEPIEGKDQIPYAEQQMGRFYLPDATGNGSERWAVLTSEEPLTYEGPQYCRSLPFPDSFEPFTLVVGG